jgi:hypothetical protein
VIGSAVEHLAAMPAQCFWRNAEGLGNTILGDAARDHRFDKPAILLRWAPLFGRAGGNLSINAFLSRRLVPARVAV